MTTTIFYSPPISSIGGSVQSPSYVVWQVGGTIYAQSSAGSGLQAYSGTDAATVIQNAITALATNGGTIFIRAGTYTIQTPIDIENSNIHIVGEGMSATILQAGSKLATYTGTLPEMFAISETAIVSNVSVSDLTLDGSTATSVAAVITGVLGIDNLSNLAGPSNVLIRSVRINLFAIGSTALNNGIQTNFATTSATNTVFEKVVVDGSAIKSNATGANGFATSDDCTLIECVAQNLNPASGTPTLSSNAGFSPIANNLITLIGCVAQNCWNGFVTSSACTLIGCTAIKNQMVGFDVTLSNGLVTTPLSMTGCSAINNGQYTSGANTSRCGLRMGAGSPNSIVGCAFNDTQGTPTQVYGIVIGALGNVGGTCSIQGGSARGNKTAAVYIDANSWGINADSSIKDLATFTPVNKITTPFLDQSPGTKHFITPTSSTGTPTAGPLASTDYKVEIVPVLITSTGGTGVSITLKDAAGNTIQSGLATVTEQLVPISFMVNWGAFSAGPTVTAWGLGE